MRNNHLQHLAIIMDGNARWAKQHNLSKAKGHAAGAERANELIINSLEFGIKYITLYAFSSENWQRPATEIQNLLELFEYYIKSKALDLHKHGIKLKIIGNLDKLPILLRKKISSLEQETTNNQRATLAIAFSYGAREEITNAAKKLAMSSAATSEFAKYLYDPEMPDVDLLIRTGGQYRLSNFLLWQIAYAELYFLDKLWPDFTKTDLENALQAYQQRQRNFGTRQ